MSYELFQENPTAYILILLLSLLITMVAYGAFPLLIANLRQMPIVKKKYKRLCWGVNIGIMFIFILINGQARPACFLWTPIFTSLGVKKLSGRGLLMEFMPESDIDSSEDQDAEVKVIEEKTDVTEKSKDVTEELDDAAEVKDEIIEISNSQNEVDTLIVLESEQPIVKQFEINDSDKTNTEEQTNYDVENKQIQETKICPKCGKAYPLDGKFCPFCGEVFKESVAKPVGSKYCIFCGASLPEEAIFCASCGKKQPTQN